VGLKLRDGEIYGSVSFEIPTPEVRYTKENGVIAIDTNASPIHLAIAEVSKTGELLSYQTISLHHLLGLSQNSKDHQEWILAHQIVDLAIQKGKAIAIENLKKLKKGMRGDGKATQRPPIKKAILQAKLSSKCFKRYKADKEAIILPKFQRAVMVPSTFPLWRAGTNSSIADWIAANSPPKPAPAKILKNRADSKLLAKPVKKVPPAYRSNVRIKSFFLPNLSAK
jgi:hypothetical protein